MGVAGSRPQQSPSTDPPNPRAVAAADAPPASNTEPEAESWRESGWIDHEWNESPWNPGQTDRSQQRGPGLASGSQSGDRWTTWQDNRSTDWNQGRWEKNNWKDEEREDRGRPYLSRLDFPSFNGNKEQFATYRYPVLDPKAHCGPKDHKYLAPRLISNFKGALKDGVISMGLNSSDYLVPDGIEKLFACLRKRLNSRELDLETDTYKILQ